jgi:phosphoserine / homoserine phosphotransferase
MLIACLDLEGVLIPELWIAVADATGIPELRRTTRDEPDYDKLMRYRLDILDKRGLGIAEISHVIQGVDPLPGGVEFLDWLRERYPVVILSDTFYGFARPLLPKLGQPTLFCHELLIDEETGKITDYRLRMPDQKRACVKAFRSVGYQIIAAGDSYNDTSMLGEADEGLFFRPPAKVVAEFPKFPVSKTYDELQSAFEAAEQRIARRAPRA